MPQPKLKTADMLLEDCLALSHVPRWTTHPVTRPQSVAEHSYRVAIITNAIGYRLGLQDLDLHRCIWWALTHDGPEAKTGDLPSPIKNALGEGLSNLEEEFCPWFQEPNAETPEAVVVKIADSMEALSWLKRYGHALKDRFDGERIEEKLTRRLWTLAHNGENKFPGLTDVVSQVYRAMLL